MGAGALLQDEQGNILIVKPTYRPDWLLPGGTTEADESPRVGCEREIVEELGLEISLSALLCLDYVPARTDINEAVMFIFYGGVLTAEQIEQIVLPADELSEFRLVPPAEALELLNPRLARRIMPSLQALETSSTAYLEDGQSPWEKSLAAD
jgi:8-oxo-dGTP pyrophosphatase MutT (NUDIX family)